MKTPATSLVYIGTYADTGQESIFLYRLNTETGELTRVKGFAGGTKPSYMTFDARRCYLYAVNEQEDYKGKESGAVCAFAVDQQTGYLTFLNRVPSLGGLPVYIAMGKEGKTVLVANYTSGNVAVFPVQENGQLTAASELIQHKGAGPNKERQETAHAHCIVFSPDHCFIFVVDLGNDKVMFYLPDAATGILTPAEPTIAFAATPGSGPRQLRFHPSGRFAYLIHELKSIITALAYQHETGTFTEIQTIATIPESFTQENKCGGVAVSSDSRFLYASNRGHNSIVVYAIEDSSGKLTHIENVPSGGEWPREFTLDLTGNFLLAANQHSDTIVSLRVNKATGKLTSTGHQTKVEKPVFVKVVPTIGQA